jgi:DNA-directed RNA polymerase subunit M/transcription elongation factor TFIIS
MSDEVDETEGCHDLVLKTRRSLYDHLCTAGLYPPGDYTLELMDELFTRSNGDLHLLTILVNFFTYEGYQSVHHSTSDPFTDDKSPIDPPDPYTHLAYKYTPDELISIYPAVDVLNTEYKTQYEAHRKKEEEFQTLLTNAVKKDANSANRAVHCRNAKCSFSDVKAVPRASRSMDEGMVVYFTCKTCGTAWKE